MAVSSEINVEVSTDDTKGWIDIRNSQSLLFTQRCARARERQLVKV